jgi:hypothetical protein
MATEVGNNSRLALGVGSIDFDNDSFKIILMATGFTFDEDAHEGYADISASELTEANGYLRNTKTLSGVTLTVNTTTDRLEVECADVTWTASGGSIGPTPGAIIFDDTVTAALGHADVVADTIVGYIDFGGDITQAAGGTFTIKDIKITI